MGEDTVIALVHPDHRGVFMYVAADGRHRHAFPGELVEVTADHAHRGFASGELVTPDESTVATVAPEVPQEGPEDTGEGEDPGAPVVDLQARRDELAAMYSSHRKDDLQALAAERDLDMEGTKADLIGRLIEADLSAEAVGAGGDADGQGAAA